jgi:hypothetical protein
MVGGEKENYLRPETLKTLPVFMSQVAKTRPCTVAPKSFSALYCIVKTATASPLQGLAKVVDMCRKLSGFFSRALTYCTTSAFDPSTGLNCMAILSASFRGFLTRLSAAATVTRIATTAAICQRRRLIHAQMFEIRFFMFQFYRQNWAK